MLQEYSAPSWLHKPSWLRIDLENVVVYAPSWLHKPSWLRVDVENVVYDALKSAL